MTMNKTVLHMGNKGIILGDLFKYVSWLLLGYGESGMSPVRQCRRSYQKDNSTHSSFTLAAMGPLQPYTLYFTDTQNTRDT